MKKVILLAITSLFMSTVAFGAFVHEWCEVSYVNHPNGINKTVYVNTTNDFRVFAELRGPGQALSRLYGASGNHVLGVGVSTGMSGWSWSWSRPVENLYVSKYNFYCMFNEPGVPPTSNTKAAFMVESGPGVWWH